MLVAVAFSTVLPPLLDYPNHLARVPSRGGGRRRFLLFTPGSAPNLAEDLIVLLLDRLMPLDSRRSSSWSLALR